MDDINFKFTASQSVLLAIVCSMVLIFFMFIGLGVALNTLLVVGGLFTTTILVTISAVFTENRSEI